MSDPSPGRIDVQPLASGRYLVIRDGERTIAYAVHSQTGTWVFVNGRVHVIDTGGAAAGVRRRGADEASLMSPMPAAVVGVHVSPQQAVRRGEVLITLEAMKMELAIRAPRDGVVAAVRCRPGDVVQPGVMLVELQPAPAAAEGAPGAGQTEPA